MPMVLDASVAAGIPLGDPALSKRAEAAFDSGLCYMTPASVAEFACIVAYGCGEALSKTWIDWLYTNPDIEIVNKRDLEECLSEEFTLLIGRAHSLSGLSPGSASAAALARKKRWPVLANVTKFAELEREGFCEVVWAR